MTIASAILANSPYVYWKLDETSGTVAADSSGHGRTGTYSGDITRGLVGPDTNVGAIRMFSTGQVASGAIFAGGNLDLSLFCYISTNNSGAVNTTNPTVGIGNPAAPTTRGPYFGPTTNNTSTLLQTAKYGGSTGFLNMTVPAPTTFWHAVGYSYVAATRVVTGYVDGVRIGTATLSAGVAPTSTDPLYIVMQTPVVVAHVAAWNRTTTDAEHLAMGGFASTWPYQLNLFQSQTPADLTPVLSNQTTEMADLTTLQTDVTTLKTNWTTYTSVTLPSLNALINTVDSHLQVPIVTATGTVTQSIGQFFAQKLLELVTEDEITSGPTGDQVCHAISVGVTAIIVRCTTVPDWYGHAGPGSSWREPGLARIAIDRGSDEVYSAVIHNTDYMLYPLPATWSVFPGSFFQINIPPPGMQVCVDWGVGVEGQVFFLIVP